jgi:hypothetical protein
LTSVGPAFEKGAAVSRFSPGSRASKFSHDFPLTKSWNVLAASSSVPGLSSSAFMWLQAWTESDVEPPISVSMRVRSDALSAP